MTVGSAVVRDDGRAGSRLGVVVPTHDRAERVSALLDLLAGQDLHDVRIVVVDDGSADDTVDRLSARDDLPPFTLVTLERNAGANLARDVGANVAGTDYLVFLDSDDRPWPGWASTLREMTRGDAGLVAIGRQAVDQTGATLGRLMPRRSAFLGDQRYSFLPGCFALSTELYRAVGGYDADQVAAQHTELLYRLAELYEDQPFRTAVVDEVLLDYVHHEDDSIRKDPRRVAEGADRLATLHREFLARRAPHELANHFGVASHQYLLLGEVGAARRTAWESVRANPRRPRSWVRLARTFLPSSLRPGGEGPG